jgi:hypothetical protein
MEKVKINAESFNVLTKQQMFKINGGGWVKITLPDGTITWVWI